MDIQRPDLARKKRIKRIAYSAVLGVIILGMAVFIARLKPAAPKVDKNAVWIGTVEQGDMLRNVRGVGSLVPEEVRWITARTTGRVERILVLPGAWVEPDTVILELSNPTLVQEAQNAALDHQAAEADFVSYKVQIEGDLLQAKSAFAQLEAEFKQAQLDAETSEELFAEGLEPELNVKKARLRAEQLEVRWNLEKQRLAFREKSLEPLLASQRAGVEQTRALYDLLASQVEALKVRAGFSGVLQRQTVEMGMQVAPGENLAQVANPKKLKAVVRIPEVQAKDVQIGQPAEVDTRNGIVAGTVTRVDPNVENGTVAVDVKLKGELPKGARPDLTVEGSIELENLPNAVYVNRPVFGRAESSAGIFKFTGEGNIAERVTVNFGRASVSNIEILAGLEPGDRVILSDTSEWDQYDRIRVE